MISIIVAYDKNLAIGKDNKLCWSQPEDLKRFKSLTTGKTVVMGRKTFESIGKTLPNRTNIVLTRQNIKIEGCKVINSIDEILKIEEDVFIIGGGEIYKEFIKLASTLFVTEIDTEIEADTYFPKLSSDWNINYEEYRTKDEKNEYNYKFINYVR
jgi:dihydrofolate reductase